MTTGLQMLSNRNNVLYLPFREGSGSTAYDQSGQGNNGTISGAVYKKLVDGGYCLDFDGSNDYVGIVEKFDFMHQTGILAICFWAKWADYTRDAYQFLISNNIGTSSAKGFHIGYENRSSQGSPRRLNCFVSHGGGSSFIFDIRPTAIVDDNEWHFYVVTADGSNAYLYKDTIQKGTDTVTSLTTGSATYSTRIGLNPSAINLGFDGQIAYPMIFSRVLSLAEIHAIYRATYIL